MVERPGGAAQPALPCPKCKNPMHRGFYSLNYLVEVDRCSGCGVTWFDRDELEMLQCMIEHRLAPGGGDDAAAAFPAGGGERI
jgi:Zn-finger nucleic acid-binding protein